MCTTLVKQLLNASRYEAALEFCEAAQAAVGYTSNHLEFLLAKLYDKEKVLRVGLYFDVKADGKVTNIKDSVVLRVLKVLAAQPNAFAETTGRPAAAISAITKLFLKVLHAVLLGLVLLLLLDCANVDIPDAEQ